MREKARSRGLGSLARTWKNSRALFARDREYMVPLVRTSLLRLPIAARWDSTKKANNARLISTLAGRTRSTSRREFLRLCSVKERDFLSREFARGRRPWELIGFAAAAPDIGYNRQRDQVYSTCFVLARAAKKAI